MHVSLPKLFQEPTTLRTQMWATYKIKRVLCINHSVLFTHLHISKEKQENKVITASHYLSITLVGYILMIINQTVHTPVDKKVSGVHENLCCLLSLWFMTDSRQCTHCTDDIRIVIVSFHPTLVEQN